jgi:hypothetical protein
VPISTTARKTSPFVGNGTLTALPFAFKVFAAADVEVVRVFTATGLRVTLTLGSDYTVTLNGNQDTAPGGTVTLTSALPAGYTAMVVSAVPQTQPTLLTSAGGFFPSVITAALDRLTALIQQAFERVGRAPTLPVSDTASWPTIPPAGERRNRVIGFDSDGAPALVAVSQAAATAGALVYRWVSRQESSGARFLQQQVKQASEPDSAFADVPGSVIAGSLIGTVQTPEVQPSTPNPPASTSGPLAMTLQAPTSVTGNSATITLAVSGTIPAGAKMQIQIATDQNVGPWRSTNDDLGASQNAVAGNFVHVFNSLLSATTYYYRAFIYTEVPFAILLENEYPYATFVTTGGGTGASAPASPSAQTAVDLMEAGPNGDDWSAWGYSPNRFGGLISLGARLKHNADLQNYCQVSPYQDLAPTLLLPWLTVSHKFRPASLPNDALECVPSPIYGRIRPDLNGGTVSWLQLTTPTGRVSTGLILTGNTVGAPSDTRDDGRVIRLQRDFILHPWAVANNTTNTVDHPLPLGALINPADPFSESRLDCIVMTWWCRIVRWDVGQPLSDLNANPVIAVASCDPYVGRPRRVNPLDSGSPLLNDAQCNAGIAANRPVRITTQWTQVSFATITEAPDKHTNQPFTTISKAAFLANRPPGYI